MTQLSFDEIPVVEKVHKLESPINLARATKIDLLEGMVELLSDSQFRYGCVAEALQCGSHFTEKELLGELDKPVEIIKFYLEELKEGKHDYADYEHHDLPTLLMTAPNYAIGENASVLGLLNAILAGAPANIRFAASSTDGLDRFMANAMFTKLQKHLPEGFLSAIEMKHTNSDQVLEQHAGIFFIGGTSGVELHEKTAYKASNLQTGRSNYLIAQQGHSGEALEILKKTMSGRMGTSCSAPSLVFVHESEANQLIADLHSAGQEKKYNLQSQMAETDMESRFARALVKDAGFYTDKGAKIIGSGDTAFGDHLTLLKIMQGDFASIDRSQLKELFGLGFCFVIYDDTVDLSDPSTYQHLLPKVKTATIVGDDAIALNVADAIGKNAGRIHINEGPSTPLPTKENNRYVHKNTDGLDVEQYHAVTPEALLKKKKIA